IMMTFCLPLRLMLSSLSSVMPGDFSSTSMAVEPALDGEASTFIMVRSAFISTNGFLRTTAMVCRSVLAGARAMGERLFVPVIARSKGTDHDDIYPTEEAVTRYLPADMIEPEMAGLVGGGS